MRACFISFQKLAYISAAALAILGGPFAANLQAQNTASDGSAPEIRGGDAIAPVTLAIRTHLGDSKKIAEIEAEFGAPVGHLASRAYAKNGYAPIWNAAGAHSLQAVVNDMFSHGIIVSDEGKTYVASLVEAVGDPSISADERALADLRLTLVWMRVADAVTGGLSNQHSMSLSDVGTGDTDLAGSLLLSGRGGAQGQLAVLAPDHPQYHDLMAGLKTYRDIMGAGGWAAIGDGPVMKLGEADRRVPLLRTRLNKEGFLTKEGFIAGGETASQSYDAALETQVKAFQARHGLEPDGAAGKDTLRALNESVESKIDRIADTMNAMRHMNGIGTRYVWVNIPSFLAEGWNNGNREIQMRTVVGKTYTQTPVFSDEIEYVVANPNWYVPVSIEKKSSIPHMRNDPNYAAKKNFRVEKRSTGEVVDPALINWSDPSVASTYRFVQNPGPTNSLGEMKIIFPNQYSVYLHGTPAKSLFDRAERTFSHGCVRLENPVGMADWISGFEQNVSAEEIDAAVASGENKRIDLDTKIPVHITYFTVTANDDHSLNFWRDVYGRDDGIDYVKAYGAPVAAAGSAK